MGFFIGILNGLGVAFQNNRFKALSVIHPHILNWFRFLIGAAVLAIVISLFGAWQMPSKQIWFILLFLSLPIEALNAFCYIRSFQYSPQSLVGPLYAFSIILLVPLGYFFLHETPSLIGFLGILLVIIGTVSIGWDIRDPGVRRSLKNIFKERGSLYMLSAALLSAFTVIISKYSYKYIPPLNFAFYITLALALFYTPIVIRMGIGDSKNHMRSLIAMNATYGIDTCLHYIGLSFLPAVYYISVKRSSLLFDVILGKFVYKEGYFKERIFGASIMMGGLLCIALA